MGISEKRCLESGHCCWHCRYYIRPSNELRLDGPKSAVCFVNRPPLIYPMLCDLVAGERHTKPDDWCEQFEMDMPPT